MLPPALVGKTDRGSFICSDWELRVTNRCVEQDLDMPAGVTFEELRNHEIIKALISDRSDRTENTRQVSPLTSGQPIWVLSRGHDHRGGTFFDEQERVVWLVAYRRHRSGSEDDFFPYCKELDRKDRLLPTAQDYERMVRDRDGRIVRSIVIEAPLILKEARRQGTEQRAMLGGKQGACIAIEAVDDLEAITIAFKVSTIDFDLVPIVLAAFHDGAWESSERMPSRRLDPDEIAFIHIHESE
ncbi:MAG TPA: hypothetical protein VF176_09395 [Solirubrobacterales bacterium]